MSLSCKLCTLDFTTFKVPLGNRSAYLYYYKYLFDLVNPGCCALDCGPQFGSSRCCFFDNWQLPINNSIVYGIGSLPEAKIWPVKGMPKREMDSYKLYVLLGAGISSYTLAPWLVRYGLKIH